jgi:phosphatidylserine/phosphatidylglycerophosphate/cardiolipin synthase-like enzyme
MTDSQKTVFVDDEVASQVIDIVQEAKQYVILITPYLELWRHAQTALGLAVKRGVKCTVIIRKEDWKPKTMDNISWLQANGIQVKSVEWLHAKVYVNEHGVFVSSMNLTEVSTRNSLELGLAIREREAEKRVRDYIKNTVMPLAVPVSGLNATSAPQAPTRHIRRLQGPIDVTPRYASAPQAPTRHTGPPSPTVLGTCIRCGRPLYPNPLKPLCDPCYDMWAQYENEDYAEHFCHVCGRPWETSYAKPLCRDCFRKLG